MADTPLFIGVMLRLRYIGNTCGIIEKEIPEEITYEEERS